jgi:hypothetical protein
MSSAPQPLFDMSKAVPLFDMSKAEALDQTPPTPGVVPGNRIPPEMRGHPEEGLDWSDVKSHSKAVLELAGGAAGGEISAARGLFGALVRMLGTGIGAGTGNAIGQEATSGTVDPVEAAKTAGSFAAGGALGEFGASLPALKSSLSRLMYTPEGELSPLAKAVVHPTELPEQLLRKVIPEPTSATGLTKAEQDALEQKGSDLMKRQAQQDALDRKAAAAARLAAKNAPETPEPSPFGSATSTAPQAPKVIMDSLGIRWAVAPDGARVTIPKGIADADIPAYAAPKLDEQRQILGNIKGDIPKGSATPFGDATTTTAPAKIEYVNKFGKQTTGSIVDPSSPPPDVKVTYQSVPGKELYQKMMGGDGNAIREWMRRGLELPDNVKFMVEDAGAKPWRNYQK